MAVLVALLVTAFLGLLIHLLPGDPVRLLLGSRASPEAVAAARSNLFLDEPVHVQVWEFVRNALQGDLGRDLVTNQPVANRIASAFPHTVVLALAGLAIAVAGGLVMGVYSAMHPNSWVDNLTRIISISFMTMPSYVAGLFLILIFAVNLKWFPSTGAGEFADPIGYLQHLILPATSLGLLWVGYLSRIVRTSMLEALNKNYVYAARAMGVSEPIVGYKYSLRNAIIPTVAVLGVGLGNLLGGAIFVELIFARPGMGSLIVQAIEVRNYPIVRGGVLVIAVTFVLANLLADLSYRALDPRMRAGKKAAA
ncbi:peptide/nickel transport system permease protein [Paenarthrobacter sp. A20]|nr:peptide/nickel transport system permease protein [Paenarthrobacter sp. A20]